MTAIDDEIAKSRITSSCGTTLPQQRCTCTADTTDQRMNDVNPMVHGLRLRLRYNVQQCSHVCAADALYPQHLDTTRPEPTDTENR